MLDCDRDSMLFCPTADETPYEDASSVTYFNLKGLQNTISSLGFSVDEVQVLENPECMEGVSPANLAFRFRRLRRRLFSGPRRRHITDRALMVCRPTAQAANLILQNYWNSTNTEQVAQRRAA